MADDNGNKPARGLVIGMVCAFVGAILLAILFVTNVAGTDKPVESVQAQRETQR
ncbi:hypothetical protein GCM10022268_24830 [Sphingomonas cynarae]|uniref:Uncharacterized protein n=1 Tax=Sphingomonas cynarae TaxID=930197 RepID=A0ABP7E893_9SPHN